MRARTSGPFVHGSPPRTRTVPASERWRPRRRPSSVVLPAPFGPSRPVTPRPTRNVARLSTGVVPQRLTTSFASTTGSSRRTRPRPDERVHDCRREAEAARDVLEGHARGERVFEGVGQKGPHPSELGLGVAPHVLRVLDGAPPR